MAKVHEIAEERRRVFAALAELPDPVEECVDRVEFELWRRAPSPIPVDEQVSFVVNGLRAWAEAIRDKKAGRT